jgi:hypothetical protein
MNRNVTIHETSLVLKIVFQALMGDVDKDKGGYFFNFQVKESSGMLSLTFQEDIYNSIFPCDLVF